MKVYKHILLMLFSLFWVYSTAFAQNISKAEYFIGNDPGLGNAIPLPLSYSGNTATIDEDISLAGMNRGIYDMTVRVCDSLGNWSVNSSRTFVIYFDSTQNLKIASAEYYIDADPGVAAAKQITVFTAASEVTVNEDIHANDLKTGFHAVYTRFRFENGMWSHNRGLSFYSDTSGFNADTLKKVEYFIDSDPGLGAANTLADNIGNKAFGASDTLSLSGLTEGFHQLSVRAQSAMGKWSVNSGISFYTFATNISNLNAAEVFVDNDPGFGGGTALSIDSSVSKVTYEGNVDVGSANVGIHNLIVRARDASGIWSRIETRSFVMLPLVDHTPISQLEYFFDKDSGLNAGTLLSFSKPSLAVKADTDVQLQQLDSGYHYAYTRVTDSTGNTSMHAKKKFYICNLLPEVSFLSDTACLGDSVRFINNTLNVDGNTKYYWDINNDGKNDYTSFQPAHKYAAAGLYFVRLIATNGGLCADTAIVPVFVDQAIVTDITALGATTFCNGDSVVLTSKTDFLNYTWSNGAAAKTTTVKAGGSYYLIGKNKFCSDTSNIVSVTVKPLPAIPTITGAYDKITADNDIATTWYAGADTSQLGSGLTYYPKATGSYYAKNKLNGCYSENSDTLAFIFDAGDCIHNFRASFSADTVCVLSPSAMINTTDTLGFGVTSKWDIFNDNTFEFVSKNASYIMPAAGNFAVKLVVKANTVCTDSVVKTVHVAPVVDVGIVTTGQTLFCQGDSVTFTADADYRWYNWSTGATTKSIYVATDGIYYLVGSNGFCSDTSALVSATTKPLPLAPNLEEKNGAIYADVKKGVQWYEQSAGKLVGDTFDILIPLTSGNYYAITAAKNGCFSLPSESVHFEYDSLDCYTDFSYTIDTANLTVQFSNLASTSAKAMWNFGDGNYSFNMQPQHKYASPGRYTVCLTAHDTISGCLKKICKEIVLGELTCSSVFAYGINHVTKTVTLTDLSTGTSEWFWAFGDGALAKTRNAQHTYDTEGIYKICHWVRNKATNCFDQSCVEIQIGKPDTSNLSASFTYFAEPGTNKVTFSNKSSANVTSFYWTFGDGNFVTDENPAYEYAKPGSYSVCLNVFDEATGKADEYCEDVAIGQTSCNIMAGFSTIVKETREVLFYNESVGNGADYYWTFGDGSTATTEHAAHQYDGPGYYFVSLAVRSADGLCSDYTSELVKVGETGCKAMFDFQVDPLTNTVAFENKSSGNIKKYFWHFGNGVYSTDENPSYFFEKDGAYKITLTVSNQLGTCMDNYSAFVQVGKVKCDSRFSYFVDSASNTVYFNDEVVGSSTNLLWSFGDGSVTTKSDPKHKFRKQGYYKVGLNTFNITDWCMDYYEETILVGSAGNDCEADFIFQSETDDTKVQFYDKSLGNVIGYIWNFGDGVIESEKNPVHSYNKPGYYNVCHMVVNNDLITNMVCKPVIAATGTETNCLANFSFTVDSSTLTAYLIDASEGDIAKWSWDLGNGNDMATKQVTAKYAKAGYYLVDLRVANSLIDCHSRAVKLINVAKPGVIKAGFLFEALQALTKAGGYPVDFVGAGLGDQARLRWSFGDGTVDSTTNAPSHTFQQPGTYKVCYEVSDPVTNQKDSVCQMVTIEGGIGIKEKSSIATAISVYPNPLEQMVSVQYKLAAMSHVTIRITDLQGRALQTLVSTIKMAGEYAFTWDTRRLSKGTYLLQLQSSSGDIITKVLIKQ